MKRIYAIEEVCIGCHLCEVYCQVEHSRSRNIIKTFKDEVPPPSRITVEEDGPVSFALQSATVRSPIAPMRALQELFIRTNKRGRLFRTVTSVSGAGHVFCRVPRVQSGPTPEGPGKRPNAIYARAGKPLPASKCAPMMRCI